MEIQSQKCKSYKLNISIRVKSYTGLQLWKGRMRMKTTGLGKELEYKSFSHREYLGYHELNSIKHGLMKSAKN
jgi:hypothetical protein